MVVPAGAFEVAVEEVRLSYLEQLQTRPTLVTAREGLLALAEAFEAAQGLPDEEFDAAEAFLFDGLMWLRPTGSTGLAAWG